MIASHFLSLGWLELLKGDACSVLGYEHVLLITKEMCWSLASLLFAGVRYQSLSGPYKYDSFSAPTDDIILVLPLTQNFNLHFTRSPMDLHI